MIPVPEIRDLDNAFGNIDHLPPYDKIPDIYKHGNNQWNDLVSKWFFIGLKQSDIDSLVPKQGVDKRKALRVISAILKSWAPKHEHKEAGAAFLFSEWFENNTTK